MERQFYLGELLKVDNIDILKEANKKNIFIVAPCGCGKTYFIQGELCNDKTKKYLYLCDTKNLKDQQMLLENSCNSKGEIAKVLNDKIEVTKKYFGRKNVTVMCYEEFGRKVKYDINNEFIQSFDMIIADEIHDLIKYQKINDSANLHMAFVNLIKKYDKTAIIFMTATPSHLDKLIDAYPNLDNHFIRMDYEKDKRIKRYISLVTDTYSHYKQIPTIINSKYKQGVCLDGLKILIYTREIETMKIIESSLKEIEYLNPICLWSISKDTQKNHPFIEKQFEVRDYLLANGELLKDFNVLIINSSMEAGVNIYDEKMMYCIINSTNEDEQEQARGRIRHDIIELRLKEDKKIVTKDLYNLNEKWLNKPLTTEDKNALCELLNIYDSKGRLIKWTTLKKLLIENGYIIKDAKKSINNIQVRVSIINKR